MSALYLIPVTLGDVEHRRVLPEYNREVILSIRHFIVENVRTARRFLKKTEPSIVIDNLVFYELNKHTSAEAVAAYLAPLALSADRCFTAYECDQEAGRAHLFGEPDAVVHRNALPQ